MNKRMLFGLLAAVLDFSLAARLTSPALAASGDYTRTYVFEDYAFTTGRDIERDVPVKSPGLTTVPGHTIRIAPSAQEEVPTATVLRSVTTPLKVGCASYSDYLTNNLEIWSCMNRLDSVQEQVGVLERIELAPGQSVTLPNVTLEVQLPSSYDMRAGDFAALQAVNPVIAAWMSVPGTAIDYPVVQAGDNSYHLRRLATCSYEYNNARFILFGVLGERTAP